MKIAMICTEKLPVPPIRGGAIQQYISGVLPYLAENHEITVFSRDDINLEPDESVKEVRYIRTPAPSADAYIQGVVDKLDANYDLVHIFNRPRWVNKVANRFPNMKISLSVHNEMFLPSKIPAIDGVRCINKLEFISTVSRFIATEIVTLYPQAEGKVYPVYSGVDIKKYLPVWSKKAAKIRHKLRKKHALAGKYVVLYVGRFSPKKGAHILLRAMHTVAKAIPNTALVFVGSKWYGENREDAYVKHIRQLAEQLEIDVVFTGFLPPSEVTSYYYLGDVFVCASQWQEPLARVHYEAMAAGLPTITTNRGGNAEVIQGNGIVIDAYDQPEAFAEAIQLLHERPELAKKMGRRGRKLAESKYSWERVADELDELFLKTTL